MQWAAAVRAFCSIVSAAWARACQRNRRSRCRNSTCSLCGGQVPARCRRYELAQDNPWKITCLAHRMMVAWTFNSTQAGITWLKALSFNWGHQVDFNIVLLYMQEDIVPFANYLKVCYVASVNMSPHTDILFCWGDQQPSSIDTESSCL